MERNGAPAGEDELILALAAGATVREAAERADVGEPTAYRRLADADFRRAVSETRGRMFDAVVGRLASLAGKATETLERLMESDKPTVALAAAKAVLELGPRLRKSTEAEERISRLEDQAGEKTDGNHTPAGDGELGEGELGETELILALAAGATTRKAAEQAGIEERTAHRRLAEADFRRAVSRARGRMLDSALGRLAGLASKATGIFERLMESDQPSVARKAAKAVLELGPRLRESELEERISRLEDQADEKTDQNPAPVVIDNGWYGDSWLPASQTIES